MFENFALRHIPALIVATTTAFGGIWPMFDAKGSMQEFGFPTRIASAPAAAPVMVIGQARGTIIGLLVFLFYSRSQFELVDTVMAVTGAWAGLVDSYVVWKQGNGRYAAFRLISSGLISAWGFADLTVGRS